MLGPVKDLRVEAVPPFLLALNVRERAIVWNTGKWTPYISPMRGLEPPPVSSLVNCHAESQSAFSR